MSAYHYVFPSFVKLLIHAKKPHVLKDTVRGNSSIFLFFHLPLASWYGPTSVSPVVLKTNRSGANFESDEEEMLTTIMGGEPTERLLALQLTGPEVSYNNQSLAQHEETFDVVSPWCYTRRKKERKGQDA